MQRAQTDDAKRILRELLERVGRKELTAPPTLVARLAGALGALEAQTTKRRRRAG